MLDRWIEKKIRGAGILSNNCVARVRHIVLKHWDKVLMTIDWLVQIGAN
jgi:hypothetical protein